MRNMIILIILIILFLFTGTLRAQTAAEILAQYTEKSGGQAQWEAVNSMRVKGKVHLMAQNMELPFLRIMVGDGKQLTSLQVNGSNYVETAYDGETIWGTNSKMQIEEKDAYAKENLLRSMEDFPYPGHNWKERGFELELLGTEKVNEKMTYKVKLIKQPVLVDGVEEENFTILYFDTTTYLPIKRESRDLNGGNEGELMIVFLEDYREVEGFWYPFRTRMIVGDEVAQIIETETVEFNQEIDIQVFKMPGTK